MWVNFKVWILFVTVMLGAVFIAPYAAVVTAPTPAATENIYRTPATLFVHITAFDSDGLPLSMGSGVLAGDRIITAKHVLNGAAKVRALIDGFPEESSDMFLDPVYDLGVIRLPWSWGTEADLFYPTSRLPYGSILVTAGGTAGSETVVVSQGIYGGHGVIPGQKWWSGEMLIANIGGGPGNSGGGVYHNNRLVGILVGNCGSMTISEPVEHVLEMLERYEAQEESQSVVDYEAAR